MPDLLTLPRRPEVANTYDDFGQPHQTASGSGSTLARVTIGRAGKRAYIGLSGLVFPSQLGPQDRGKARGKWGVAAGTLARQHNDVLRVFDRARSCNLASRQCRGSTGISQNGVSGVPLWDPVFAPLPVLPFNHSSCIYVSQDSGW
jgi:hypothetical protein